MNSLLLLHCCLFLIGYSLADNAGNCDIDGILEEDYSTTYSLKINDTQINTNILETTYTGNLEVRSCAPTNNDHSTFFNVSSTDTSFIIATTAAFANFDEITNKQSNEVALVTLQCTLFCVGQSSLTIQVSVTDINTHPPEFTMSKYEYKVATPIMPLTDFTIYGDEVISVQDIDFSNQAVTFTVEPNDFAITTSSSSSSKQYNAVFAARNVVQLLGNRTYTITATDSGTIPGPLTSTVTLTLMVDEDQSLDIPSFDRSSYSFNYTIVDTSPTLTQIDGPITIDTNKPTSLTNATLTGTFSDYFKVTPNLTSSTIGFSINELLPTDTGSFVVLTLSISTDNRASTSIIVYPIGINDVPQFSNHYYTGSYSNIDSSVTLDNSITIASTGTPTVSISGEYAEHFTIIFSESSSSYRISVSSDLTATEIKLQSYITLTLNASLGENYDTAVLILSLPEYSLQFTEALYNASYNSNKTVTIDASKPIGFTTDVTNVVINTDGTYASNFAVTYNTSKNQWLVSVDTPLDEDTLRAQESLVITLTATDAYDDIAQSVLTIYLPTNSAPEFSETIYLGNYSSNGDDSTITLDKNIIISNVDNLADVTITLDSYNENFAIVYDNAEGTWTLNVISALSQETLLSKKEIIITLIAEEGNNDNRGQAVLLITWSIKEAPQFTEAYYLAIYPENKTGTIVLESPIGFTNIEEPNNIVISLDSYTDNFEITYSSDKWAITLKNSLDQSVLSKNAELVIVLTATETDNDSKGQSVLVIELPSDKMAPKFSGAYYIANYPDSGTGVIEFDNPISFTNVDDPATIEITLDTYSENFDIVFNSTNWHLNIKSGLDETILHKNAELVVTLIATETGVENKGESVLVLKLPTARNGTALKFSEAYYIAEYPKNGTGVIEFEKPINFVNIDDPTDVTINLDNYEDYFEIQYSSNSWYINIKSSLEDTTLYENVELVMTLIAYEEGNAAYKGESALVLKLPSAINGTAPKFSNAYYLADYPENGVDTIEFGTPIEFLNVDDSSTVTISLDNYEDNFDITYDSNRWYINIKNSLDQDIFQSNKEIVMTLIASETGNQNFGEAALVLKLPAPTNATAPKFSEAYYLADYPESGTGTIEFENPVKFLNIDNPTTVVISLDNYTDNFGIEYDAGRWYINIKESLQLIISNNTEIVMTLIATETDNTNTGKSALVLRLPIVNAPEFSAAYYLATYPEDGTSVIEFETPIAFSNVNDPTSITITLDNYGDNFNISYESNSWHIIIKNSLDQDIFQTNKEIVMTLIASETGNLNFGEAVLVLKLPAATNATAPKFSDAYYLADYPEDGTSTIEFENPLTFLNIANPTTVVISLDNYADNFDIEYDEDRWYIHIKNSLEQPVLNSNTEIVMTLIATETDNTNTGKSALVLRLPIDNAPEFSAAYYLATYPEDGTSAIEFETPIAFSNIDDPTSIAITLDNYTTNFNIVYESSKWYINITNSLDTVVLYQNVEIVMTLIATKAGNTEKGEATLVLKLPTAGNGIAPKFLEAFYLAEYPEDGTGLIEFETSIKFSNVNDLENLTISLDTYYDNFNITYEDNRWVINIENILEGTILDDNKELVMTLIATELGNPYQGESALVLKLPLRETDLKFAEAYYIAQYPANGTGMIELENLIDFTNVEDPTTVEINLDSYSDNFEIIYDTRWYINIKSSLAGDILGNNSELVMTLAATSTEYKNSGYSALVLNLPATNDTSIKFLEAYYIAKYPEGGSGTIEFENSVAFLNVEDPATLTISLDNYASNFAIKHDSGRWYIDITSSLEESVLTKNTELVMTMIATEESSTNTAESALVIKLPASDDTAPLFTESYYIANYLESATGIIEFENPIEFVNVNDPTTLTLTLNNYVNNFEILYEENRWYITIKNNLEDSVLNKNAELVMTITATKSENMYAGYATLILKLPAALNITAPRFAEAYYLAEYPTNDDTSIEFENPVEFLNIDDPNTITITLDNYSDNFQIVYELNKWYILITNTLETSILTTKSEIVMTLVATETGNKIEGYAALVLKLPAGDIPPEFTEAYYKADYPKDAKGYLELEKPIDFLNVEDPSTITITLDNYTNNFDIGYVSNVWTINIKDALEESVLSKETELVLTLTATQTGNNNEGRSALVLKLPASELAPVFSESYYEATYIVNEGQASIVFTDAINITNKGDLSKIVITVDNYQENFNIVYYSDSNTWVMNVNEELSDTILINKTDIVVTLTATDTSNDLAGHSVVYLNLPSLNTDESPRFSKTYYTAKYTISGDTPLITFDTPINITNRANLTAVSIGTDNYAQNFRITYDEINNEWTMNVIENLDEAVLNAKVDLVMALIASENSSNIAQAALVLTLPLVNNDEAPKFSRIYYSGDYISDTGIVNLENAVEIVNKVDLTKITISFDDSYRDNFEIIYDSGSSKWLLNVNTPLSDSILNTTPDIVLTLTATEDDNTNIGQAALILHLPLEKVQLSPKFNLAHYFARYEVTDGKPNIILNDSITIINKDLVNITIALDSYDTYFNVNYNASAKQWTIAVAEPLLDEIMNSNSELVVTLVATEIGNDNLGESTLIVKLPASSEESPVKFSQVHYTANYSIAQTSVIMNEKIELVLDPAVSELSVSLESNDYSNYFTIDQEGDNYVVNVQSPLPLEILESQVSLVMTIVATVDSSTSSYATLVINLPVSATGRDIVFSQALYTATYDVVDEKANFQVNGTIQVETDEEDANIEYAISSDTGYQSYFQISYSSKVVTVELSSDLPESVLTENTFIPFILTVGITGTTVISSTVLNVEIQYDGQGSTSISFSSVLYHATYEVTNTGQHVLTIEDPITVVTDEADVDVNISLSSASGFDEYFTKTYDDKKITIVMAKELPESIVRQNSIIPLILSAGITGSELRAYSVLNIQIIYNDEGNNTILIEFSNVLFNGKYEVTDGTGALTIEDQIAVITNRSDSTIAVTVTNEFADYFTVTYGNKVVSVELAKQLTTDILTSNTFVPLTLQAAITGTSSQALAVLNIRIKYDSESDTGSIEFGAVLYSGEYSVSDGSGILKLNETIRVITDQADNEIESSISNDAGYDRYFTISYSSNTISVGLNGNLPTDIVENNAFIALTLSVGIKETTHRSSAVLNIEIDNSDDGGNGNGKTCANDHKIAYIVVIVILCILVIVLIGAAIAFYWFKLRGDRGYENFEDEDGHGKVRFDKNTLQRSSTENKPSTIEGRRPTGFIFNPIGEENLEAINDVDYPNNTGNFPQ